MSRGHPRPSDRFLFVSLAILVAYLLAAPAAGTAPPGEDPGSRSVPAPLQFDTERTPGCPPDAGPADPPSDRLGWEAGCWYNESIAVNRADGLTAREVDALAARAMARVEVIRDLEFREPPTIEVRPRSSYDGGNRTVPRARVLRKNVRLAALYIVDGDTNAVRSGFGIGGYYAYWDNRVVLVSRNGSLDVHEFELAHELVHVLQRDHFRGSAGSRHLFDRQQARSALTEGEANYVTQEYKRRCRGPWEGTCLPPENWTPRDQQERGQWCDVADPHFNLGRSILGSVPYTVGPAFVGGVRDRRGWAGVDDLHANPPESTEQVLHPEKYPTDRPTDVTVRDRSRAGWRVVRPAREGRPTQFRLGEAALFTMLWYQSFHSDHEAPIIPCMHAYRPSDPRALLDYSHPLTAGWDGDALVPYVAAGTGNATDPTAVPTGYVWKLIWDSPADTREFAGAYRDLLAVHGATPVPGRADTYRIPDSSGFRGTTYLRVTNASVLVVNAPSVEAVRAIRPDAAPRATTAGQSPDGDGEGDGEGKREGKREGSPGRRGPGFGVVPVLAALAVLGVWLGLSRR